MHRKFVLMFLVMFLSSLIFSLSAKGKWKITANIENCNVYIDGKSYGKPPVYVDLEAKQHSIVVVDNNGYLNEIKETIYVEDDIARDWVAQFDLRKEIGKIEDLSASAKLGKGTLTIYAKPDEGTICKLSNGMKHSAPTSFRDCSAGEYQLFLQYNGSLGSAESTMTVIIPKSRTKTISIDWVKAFAEKNEALRLQKEAELNGFGMLNIESNCKYFIVDNKPYTNLAATAITVGLHNIIPNTSDFEIKQVIVDIKPRQIAHVIWDLPFKAVTLPSEPRKPFLLPETIDVIHPNGSDSATIRDKHDWLYKPTGLIGLIGSCITPIMCFVGFTVPNNGSYGVAWAGLATLSICFPMALITKKVENRKAEEELRSMRRSIDKKPIPDNIAKNERAKTLYQKAVYNYNMQLQQYDSRNQQNAGLREFSVSYENME